MKGFWFKTRGRQLLEQLNPECVAFQDNAWYDEKIMDLLVVEASLQWDMLLALGVHKVQTTDAIQECLRKHCKTEPIFVPPGTTSQSVLYSMLHLKQLWRGRQPNTCRRT